MNTKYVIQGFPPIVGDSPKILILGTMPGKDSLLKQQYYVHVRNQFWKIIGEQVQCSHDSSYETRKQAIKKAGVAVWDVLKYCDRKDSLDSSIKKEVLNDIAGFLDNYPTIVRIGFNGRDAEEYFNTDIGPNLVNMEHLQTFYLPSTSPTYAKMSLKEKREWWAKLFKDI